MALPSFVKVSLPTRAQVIHGAERVLGVFVVGAIAYLKSHHGFDFSTLHSAYLAGAAAVYQLALSIFTTL